MRRCGVFSTIRVIVIVWIEVNSESRRLVSLQSSASFQLPQGDWDNLGNYMITFLGSARWALVSSLHISWKTGVKEPVTLCAKSMVRRPHCHSLSTDWHRHWSGWARQCAFTYRRMMPPFWPVTKKDPPIIKFRKLMTKILCATSLRKDRIPLLNT